jgi:uncharacterized membrane protein YheB (UPF0754 family)
MQAGQEVCVCAENTSGNTITWRRRGLLSAEWLVLPTVGALIGYLTNVIAIRMLFRPRRPLVIPGTSLTFQGLIPRRHADLARAIGDIVEKDLLPVDSLVDRFDTGEYHDAITASIADHVDKRVRAVLPGFLPLPVQDTIATFVCEMAGREASQMVAAATENLRGRIKQDLHVGELVFEKVMALDLDQLEKMVLSISGQELRYIEVFGALLGFVIGVIQAALILAWR